MTENGKMKILTWNIRNGGGKDCAETISALLQHNADIIALTEYQSKNELPLIKAIRGAGYKFIETTNPEAKENGILVASKQDAVTQNHFSLDQDEKRWLSFRIPSCNLQILAVHIPGAPDHKFVNGFGISGKARKELFWQKILEYAEANKNNKTLILGDFNTGLKEDAEGTPFILSKYMKDLISIGYVDAWRAVHKNKKEYTWYSQHKVNGTTVDKNGFRLDYLFVAPTCKSNVLNAYHSHYERLTKISDHSVLIGEVHV